MPSHYTVIQYVPDPVRGERVNVGVAAYSGGQVETRLLVNWDRVKAFCGAESLTRERLEAILWGVDQARLEHMIGTWTNSIQFTEPGTSLYPVSQTLDVAAERFLVDPPKG